MDNKSKLYFPEHPFSTVSSTVPRISEPLVHAEALLTAWNEGGDVRRLRTCRGGEQ